MIRPYVYVFDADTAANGLPLNTGANYNRQPVPILSCDRFTLSRIAGIQNVASRYRLYDAGSFSASSIAQFPTARDIMIVPSLVYPVDSAITFDLENITLASRATAGTPNYWSQIAFQGQRDHDAIPYPDTPYRWRPIQYTHRFEFTLDWTGRILPAEVLPERPRRFQYTFNEYDFELHRISIWRTGQTTPTPAETDFKIQIYDSFMYGFSNAPVLDSYINAGSLIYNSQFPAPTVVFPVNSAITFDITSLQTAANLPRTFQIVMQGIWRVTC